MTGAIYRFLKNSPGLPGEAVGRVVVYVPGLCRQVTDARFCQAMKGRVPFDPIAALALGSIEVEDTIFSWDDARVDMLRFLGYEVVRVISETTSSESAAIPMAHAEWI